MILYQRDLTDSSKQYRSRQNSSPFSLLLCLVCAGSLLLLLLLDSSSSSSLLSWYISTTIVVCVCVLHINMHTYNKQAAAAPTTAGLFSTYRMFTLRHDGRQAAACYPTPLPRHGATATQPFYSPEPSLFSLHSEFLSIFLSKIMNLQEISKFLKNSKTSMIYGEARPIICSGVKECIIYGTKSINSNPERCCTG